MLVFSSLSADATVRLPVASNLIYRWLMRASCRGCLFGVVLLVAACDDLAPPSVAPTPVDVPVEVCAGEPAPTRTDWSYDADTSGSEALDFTDYERAALQRLHDAGWNGHGVNVMFNDFFEKDGSPSHGTAVMNIARRYAPNARLHQQPDPGQPLPYPPSAPHVVNRSLSGPVSPDAKDRLAVPQSRSPLVGAGAQNSTFVYGAGNVGGALPQGDPARAEPTLTTNGLVEELSNPTGIPADERTGYLHAQGAVLVVGAVDYRDDVTTDGGWILSHDDGTRKTPGHSARAGEAQHAFLVAPDDNRPHKFSGTSFAAPRVSAALAVLSQKCPTLTAEQLGYVLLRSATDLGEPGIDPVYGYGLLNLENAVAKAKDIVAGFDAFDSTIPPTP